MSHKVVSTAEETTDPHTRLHELIAQARQTARRDAALAVALATTAEQLAVALGDTAARIKAVYVLGRSLAVSGKYDVAFETYARALALCETHGLPALVPTLLQVQGRLYRSAGNGAEAFRVFTHALTLARETGDCVQEANILSDLGVLYALFDIFDTAQDMQEQALALARDVPDFPALDRAYLTKALGLAYRVQGDVLHDEGDHTAAEAAYDNALPLLTEAAALAQAETDMELLGLCAYHIGMIALARGDTARCRELLQNGEAIVAQLGAFRAGYFYCAGLIEVADGNYHAALAALETAREIYERIGVRSFIAPLHRQMSACYEALGDTANALTHYKRFSEYDRITAREKARQAAMLTALNNQLHERALRDPLTGLYNRRYLDETLKQELANAVRAELPMSVVTVDVDHFKGINDTYGHAAGDAVLRAVAEALRTQTRAGDVVCRLGGEEFVVVLPGAGAEAASRWAEERRIAFAALGVTHEDVTLRVTFSAGVATAPGDGATVEALLAASDAALYAAKGAGRNRVVAFHSEI